MSLGSAPTHGQPAPVSRPLLSITMPTKDRPQLLARALASVARAVGPDASRVELTVSDGSANEASARVVERFLTSWAGEHRYVHNRPPLPLVDNMNRAIELASGEWVMQLDDDDYLLPGASVAMLEAIRGARPEEAVLLFGVDIVNADGVRSRRRRFRHEQYLEPAQALERLLRNSSFVREPAVLVRRTALEREGLFDPRVGGPADTDMWVRLFARYGVRCFPSTTCAYTVHEAAATTGMWNPDVIATLGEIFDRAAATAVVPERTLRHWQADFLHQFILAGAYRRLRVRRRAEAAQVLRLFELPEVRVLGVSRKWWPVRVAFTAATAGTSYFALKKSRRVEG
jgi:glycosyltransferase involved in cell wall biosynthesis